MCVTTSCVRLFERLVLSRMVHSPERTLAALSEIAQDLGAEERGSFLESLLRVRHTLRETPEAGELLPRLDRMVFTIANQL